ncbi:MAG: cation:proton antiporter [Myxococcota bacterium]
MIVQVVGVSVLTVGLLAAVVGVAGLHRMPSFYLRMKPFSLVTTVAAFGVHVGSSVLIPGTFGYKGLLTALVFLMTGPALAQALMHTARRLRVPHRAEVDELAGSEAEPPPPRPQGS